ncbi:MAG TPA: hypothetical protein VNK46_00490 [Nitrospiraceae bacterium]|jgi:hypothetical protein|nr:hypothetical protein [Nitrospiraceae bacterium]
MGRESRAETDEERLKKKIAERLAGHANPEGDRTLRVLRKRLKRLQRKRRSLAMRKRYAVGKQGETKTEAAA